MSGGHGHENHGHGGGGAETGGGILSGFSLVSDTAGQVTSIFSALFLGLFEGGGAKGGGHDHHH